MNYMPVLASLGRSLTLKAFNEVLSRLKVDGSLSAAEVAALLTSVLGREEAGKLVKKLYGDSPVDGGSVAKLGLALFGGGLKKTDRALLRKKMSALSTTDAKTVEIKLAGFEADVDDLSADAVDLLIEADSGARLKVDACPVAPGSADPDCDMVRLELSGWLRVGAEVGFSLPPVGLALEGGAEAMHSAAYYLRGQADATVGGEALRGLSLIGVSPGFRVRSLLRLLGRDDGRIAAVTLSGRQQWRLGGQLKLAKKMGLAGGGLLDLGVDVAYRYLEEGHFVYSFSVQDRGLEVTVAKARREESASAASFGVELDLEQFGGDLFPRLKDELGDAGKAFERVLEWLPEPGFVRRILTEKIALSLDDFEYVPEVLAVLGPEPSSRGRDRVADRLGELMARTPALWNDSSAATAEQVIDAALGRLSGLSPDIRARLKGKLQSGVEKALQDLDKQLRARLREEVEGAYDELARTLSALGDELNRRLRAVDSRVTEVAEKVRARVQRYQALVGALGNHLESAASRRIGLRLGSETQRYRAEDVQVRLLFNPDAPHADEYLRKLLAGDVESVFRTALKKDPAGPVIALREAALERYARIMSKQTSELVLFGFEMGTETILDVDTRIIEDGAGKLTIVPTTRFSDRLSSLTDQRRFDFINVYELANARATGSLTIGFSVYREEEGLDTESVKRFVGSAGTMGLVIQADLDRLDAVLARADRDFEIDRSRVNIGVTLTGPQVGRLIGYGAPVASQEAIPAVMTRLCLPKADEEEVTAGGDEGFPVHDIGIRTPAPALPRPLKAAQAIEIASRALERSLAVAETTEYKRDDLIALLRHNGYQGGIADAIRDLNRISLFAPHDQFEQGQRAIWWLEQRHKAVTALAEHALLGIWAIYHSGPYNWNVDRYNRCQERAGTILKDWFSWSGQQGWHLGLRDEVRPLILALMRTFLDLADTDPMAPGPLLSVDLQLLDDEGNVVKTLMVAGGVPA